MSIAETSSCEPPSKRKEKLDGQDREPKPHEMGLQLLCRVHTPRVTIRLAASGVWGYLSLFLVCAKEPFPHGKYELRKILTDALELLKKISDMICRIFKYPECESVN